MYLAHNKLQTQKAAIRRTETLAERYLLLDSLLFRLNTTPEKESAVLTIPESCVDRIFTLYHIDIVAGHYGVIKTYLTIKEKFFISDLLYFLTMYIKACHICQLHKNENYNSNYKAMTRVRIDLQVMPRSYKGNKFILVVIDELTSFVVTIPIYQSWSEETGYALIEHVFRKYSISEHIIMDQDSGLMSIMIHYLLKKLGIKIETVAPYNHQP